MNTEWRNKAACLGRGNLWDETVDDVGAEDRETRAERAARHSAAGRICAACPVRNECWADGKPGRDEGMRSGRMLQPLHRNSRPGRRAA